MTLNNNIDGLHFRRAKAERYERAYKTEGVKDALEKVRETIIKKILNAQIGSQEVMQYHAALTGFDMFEHYFISLIADGKAAQSVLDEMERQKEGTENG